MRKYIVMVDITHPLWRVPKTAIVRVMCDSHWVSDAAKEAFTQACKRLHINEEECELMNYRMLPNDTLFVNCGDYL